MSLAITAFWHFGDANSSPTIADSTGRGNAPVKYIHPGVTAVALRLGNTLIGTQRAKAALAYWFISHQALSTATLNTIQNGTTGSPYSTLSGGIQAVMRAYLDLTETGGSTAAGHYVDQTGHGNNGTANNANVTQVAGPGGSGNASQLDGTCWVEVPSSADVQTGFQDCTIGGWAKLTAKTGDPQYVFWGQIASGGGSITNSGSNVYYENVGDRFTADVDGGDNQDLAAGLLMPDGGDGTHGSVVGSPTIGTWYFHALVLDTSANTATYYINGSIAAQWAHVSQPEPVAGKLGNGSQFRANPVGVFGTTLGYDNPPPPAGNCNCSLSNRADVSPGNQDWASWFWYKADNTGTLQTIMGVSDDTVSYSWMWQLASNVLYFVVGDGLGTTGAHYNYASVPVTADGAWHLAVGWVDKTNGRVKIDYDHGAHTDNQPLTIVPGNDATIPFLVGAAKHGAGFTQQFLNALNIGGIAKGTPTSGDLDTLWNSGAGHDWPFPGGATGSYAGSITATGTLKLATSKALAGSLAPAGTLARAASKTLAGSIAGAGTLARLTAKPFAGALAPAGTLAKAASKPLAGTVAPSGTLTTAKAKGIALTGSLAPAGALMRAAAKRLAGSIAPAGALQTSGGSAPPPVPGMTYHATLGMTTQYRAVLELE